MEKGGIQWYVWIDMLGMIRVVLSPWRNEKFGVTGWTYDSVKVVGRFLV